MITNSAFIGNRSSPLLGGTGAISNRASSVEVTNTTFTQNANQTIGNTGHFLLTNTTFADSLATPTAAAVTIASFGDAAVMLLANTILVHAPDQTRTFDCTGRITSLGNNIISDVTGCDVSFQPGDRTGDAGLDAFTDDGYQVIRIIHSCRRVRQLIQGMTRCVPSGIRLVSPAPRL